MEVGVETSRSSIGGAELGVLRVNETVVGTKVRWQLLYAVVCIMSNKSFRANILLVRNSTANQAQLAATTTFLTAFHCTHHNYARPTPHPCIHSRAHLPTLHSVSPSLRDA